MGYLSQRLDDLRRYFMKIEDIKTMLTNKIKNLELLKKTHYDNGDIENYDAIDNELTETKVTLANLIKTEAV